MGLRVNTNIASMTAQRNLLLVSTRLQGNYARLSSGLRIASPSDDPSGLGMSERMRAQIASYGVAERNAMDGISMVNTAEGALNEVANILVRMRELAMQASNGTLSGPDRQTIALEQTAMSEEIDRIATETTFNGVVMLDGNAGRVHIQVGLHDNHTIDLNFTIDNRAAAMGLGAVDLSTQNGATAALGALDSAIQRVSLVRGNLGATQNRIGSAVRSIQVVRENLTAAESRIRDVDVAMETADLTRNSILQQAAVMVLRQANSQPNLALELLG